MDLIPVLARVNLRPLTTETGEYEPLDGHTVDGVIVLDANFRERLARVIDETDLRYIIDHPNFQKPLVRAHREAIADSVLALLRGEDVNQ